MGVDRGYASSRVAAFRRTGNSRTSLPSTKPPLFPNLSKALASSILIPCSTTSGLFPYDPHCLWNGATPYPRQSAITSRIQRRFTGRAPRPLSPPDMSQSGNGPWAGHLHHVRVAGRLGDGFRIEKAQVGGHGILLSSIVRCARRLIRRGQGSIAMAS